MKAPMQLPLRGVKHSINAFFESSLEQLQGSYVPLKEAEIVYLKCFDAKLMLERFGMLSQTVVDHFNEMTLIIIGESLDKISELSQQLSQNNVDKQFGLEVKRELTVKEYGVVLHYHQFLFAERTKNPTPFSHNL